MKILFIAPLPPPINGHSLASEVIFTHLSAKHEIITVNLSRKNTSILNRVIEILSILKSIYLYQKKVDKIYFTISESIGGNTKDLLIYFLCLKNIHKMYVHLHGGSLKKLLFDKHRILFNINKFFLSRIAGAIILGNSHKNIFSDFLPNEKIHIVPNFAEDFLFISNEDIHSKFENNDTLNLLFLSNLLPDKGYKALLNAFISIKPKINKKLRLDFAGRFDSDTLKSEFLNEINKHDNIYYHGVVHGQEKKNLLLRSHVFCLPTSYLEGQPISILEAYASGCIVITTLCGGISDIFLDKINGYEIDPQNVESIANVISFLANQPAMLESIAISNRKTAFEKYRTNLYCDKMSEIIEQV